MTTITDGIKLYSTGGHMTKLVGLLAFSGIGIMLFFTNCNEKLSASLTSQMSNNVSTIAASFNPISYDVSLQTDPCNGVTDFAVCSANSAVQYLAIGKTATASVPSILNVIGEAVGEKPDNSSGTTEDGKFQWNKTSRTVWTVLHKGAGGNPVAHATATNGIYTLKYNALYSESNPRDQQIEATFNFTDSSSWTADIVFINNTCDNALPMAPSKSHFYVTRSPIGLGLWTGKAMHYFPRWQAPAAATVTCALAAGVSESTLYSDYVGDSVSTKAALYVIPPALTSLTVPGGYSLPNFCSYFASSCGGVGQPSAGTLSANPNNLCSQPQPASLSWGNNCPANTTVSPAPFASDTMWTAPSTLKSMTITVPAVL